MPTRFARRITSAILKAKLATLVDGDDREDRERDVEERHQQAPTSRRLGARAAARGDTPRKPKSGIANITTYVSA